MRGGRAGWWVSGAAGAHGAGRSAAGIGPRQEIARVGAARDGGESQPRRREAHRGRKRDEPPARGARGKEQRARGGRQGERRDEAALHALGKGGAFAGEGGLRRRDHLIESLHPLLPQRRRVRQAIARTRHVRGEDSIGAIAGPSGEGESDVRTKRPRRHRRAPRRVARRLQPRAAGQRRERPAQHQSDSSCSGSSTGPAEAAAARRAPGTGRERRRHTSSAHNIASRPRNVVLS